MADKILLKKPNWNKRQFDNTELVEGKGWVYTDPSTGNQETIVSFKDTSRYTTEDALAEEEETPEESE